MNKIIFLDIDGVLATVKQYNLSTNSKSWLRDYNVYPFDEKAVKVFNEILKETNADFVISSDWRIDFSFEDLCKIFAINKVIKTPVGITPIYPTSMSNQAKNRSGEILRYIDYNYVNDWIAIDDIDLYYWLGDHFFLCQSEWEGIKQSGLKQKILKYFK